MKDVWTLIKEGKIGMMLCDTIYGIVGDAFNGEAVERIYRIKERDVKKPLIVLIPSINTLEEFTVIDDKQKEFLESVWPGPVSVILECKKFPHLHRGTNSIAFRVSDVLFPIVSTSVNKEGHPSINNVEEAKEVFEKELDFYINQGKIEGRPSKIVSLLGGEIKVIRE